MAGERRLRILAELVAGDGEGTSTARLCRVCADVTGVSGAGIMLMTDDVPSGSICSTDPVSARLERLQFDLGEGPCLDAYRDNTPVIEHDLADPDVPRWAAFSGPAVAAGARAVFGFPMRIGAVRVGAMNLHNDVPGSLTSDQYSDALVMADIAAEIVLLLQADAPPGVLARELEAGADFRYVVHQAAGMIAVQLGVPVGQALARLRAHAFAVDDDLTEVATAVVERTLRFERDDPDEEEAAAR